MTRRKGGREDIEIAWISNYEQESMSITVNCILSVYLEVKLLAYFLIHQVDEQ